MGARPITAMNIIGVPTDELNLEIVNEILRGGADKVKEARCSLAGGHSVQNPEPLYGLSVTGLGHPDRLLANSHGHPGDVLVLTKPLGTGIISTAVKRGIEVGEMADRSARFMATLNTPGTAVAEAGLAHGGTDVTGFGLLGHLHHLCRESGLTARIDHTAVPAIDAQVLTLIDDGCVPGGTKRNFESALAFTHFADAVPQALRILLADAQTSGGLLLAVAADKADMACALLESEGAPIVTRIGELVPQSNSAVEVV